MVIIILSIAIPIIFGTLQIVRDLKYSSSSEKNNILNKCETFQREAIPRYVKLIKAHNKYKIGILDNVSLEQNANTITIVKPKKKSPKCNDFLDEAMFLFNELDAFAAFVIEGTDSTSNIAYKIQGKAFCDIINHLKVVYDLFLITNKSDYYALETLYNQWRFKN